MNFNYLEEVSETFCVVCLIEIKYQSYLQGLYDRCRAQWPHTYWAKINITSQKEDESVEDFYNRMAGVFEVHSGLWPDDDQNGQLKNAVYRGLRLKMKGKVEKSPVDLPTCTLNC